MKNRYICENPISDFNYISTGKVFEEEELVIDDFGNKLAPDGSEVITLVDYEERIRKERKVKLKKLISGISIILLVILGIGYILSLPDTVIPLAFPNTGV